MIAAIGFWISKDVLAKIYLVGIFNKIDWDSNQPCALGKDYLVYSFVNDDEKDDSIRITKGIDDEYVLRLTETKRYIIKVEGNKSEQWQLHLQNEENKFLNSYRDNDSLIFQFINYLGRSKVVFKNDAELTSIPFEVVPDKMNYEDDYVQLTEALAQRCAELLLDYSGSTSNLYSSSDDSSKTLLEQFIFLRQFCYSENIQGLFESIKRNPDSVLVQEEEFRPVGLGTPCKKLFSNPISYAKNWKEFSEVDGRKFYIPQQIAVTQKHDNVDTPANRFLKYALERFDYICLELIEALGKDGAEKQTECLREAKAIHGMLDTISRDHFFDEVGALDIMPQNSQVLQKREGYSQIFSAYSMVDMALQLDWKGKDSAYEGESKNVALLYEYWLFFELSKIIASIDGCKIVEVDESPFMKADKGELLILLVEGKKSCQSFWIPRLTTRINLYYNRTFSRSPEFLATKYEGSYSRPFRPDYTLAIFSDFHNIGNNNGELEAIREGNVSYIHFDAKYRITDLTSLIGNTEETAEEEEVEINDDKTGSIVNTYKRGDLLKMHTYNDAIRRTAGSYVLYPGSSAGIHAKSSIYSQFDEILPGVGAFAIKPSSERQSENALRTFITDLIEEKGQNSSRLNRLRYYSEMILREPAMSKKSVVTVIENDNQIPDDSEEKCVLGYIRNNSDEDYYHSLYENGLLNTGKEFVFYYYAIKGSFVYSHHRDIASATLLRFYTNDISKTGTYQIQPVLCEIEKYELVSKKELISRLQVQGYLTNEDDHNADFYYALKVRVIDDIFPYLERATIDVNTENGNDSFSPHSPKIIFQVR